MVDTRGKLTKIVIEAAPEVGGEAPVNRVGEHKGNKNILAENMQRRNEKKRKNAMPQWKLKKSVEYRDHYWKIELHSGGTACE